MQGPKPVKKLWQLSLLLDLHGFFFLRSTVPGFVIDAFQAAFKCYGLLQSDATLSISELAIPHECSDIGNAGEFHCNIMCDLGVLHIVNGPVSPSMRAYLFSTKTPLGG